MLGRLLRWWIIGIVTTPMLGGTGVHRTFVAVSGPATLHDDTNSAPGIADAADLWPKVQIRDPITRAATRRALDNAAKWLDGQNCARLFSEFLDGTGRPLLERLRQLQSTPADYLHLVYFQDGERQPACQRHGILAFTEVGSRVVYVCGRDFARAWDKSPREIVATLIHEMLHSLGLGENPPTPRDISDRVQRLCWQ